MRHLDRRSFLEVTLGGTLALTLPAPALAQGKKLGKIEHGVASVDAIYATPYVALKKNFFEAEGLEVAYLNSQSGPRSKQMLAAQQLFVTTTGANDSVALTLSGKASVIVFGLDNRVGFANILVNKELYDSGKVRKLEDLAGQTLAVTQPQAATWLMAIYILDKVGVKDKVTVRGLGDFVTMMGAVKTKQAAAEERGAAPGAPTGGGGGERRRARAAPARGAGGGPARGRGGGGRPDRAPPPVAGGGGGALAAPGGAPVPRRRGPRRTPRGGV